MKTLTAFFALLAMTASAIEFGDISPTYTLYSDADPFAIGVSTAAYTSTTNLQQRVGVLETDITGKVPATRTVTVNGVVGGLASNVTFDVVSTRLVGSGDSAAYFQTIENGTGTVWKIGPQWTVNIPVALSNNGAFVTGPTNYIASSVPYPLTLGTWGNISVVDELTYTNVYYTVGEAVWFVGGSDIVLPPPYTLVSYNGTEENSVILGVSYTNIYATYTSKAEFDAIAARVGSLEAATLTRETIKTLVNPYTATLHGDFATTNLIGFAALSTNAAATDVTRTYEALTNGQLLASFYTTNSAIINADALTLSFSASAVLGSGSPQVRYVVSECKNDTTSGTSVLDGTSDVLVVGAVTNIVASANLSWDNSVTGVRIDFYAAGTPGTRRIQLFSGPTRPMTLAVPFSVLDYATQGQVSDKLDRSGGTATNLTVAGTLYADAIRAETSAGGYLRSLSGEYCASWGMGSGSNFATTNLSASGTSTFTGTMTLNGTNFQPVAAMSFCNIRATNAAQTVVSNGTVTNYNIAAECTGFVSNPTAGVMTNLLAGYYDVAIAATMIDGNGTRTLQIRTNNVPCAYISEYSGDRAAATSAILYLPANTQISMYHDGTGSTKYHSLKAVQLR